MQVGVIGPTDIQVTSAAAGLDPAACEITAIVAGEELARVFRLARQQNVVTSLDMAMPDPGAAAGQAPWRTILENTLPFVDVFLPSAEALRRLILTEAETIDWDDLTQSNQSFVRTLR